MSLRRLSRADNFGVSVTSVLIPSPELALEPLDEVVRVARHDAGDPCSHLVGDQCRAGSMWGGGSMWGRGSMWGGGSKQRGVGAAGYM